MQNKKFPSQTDQGYRGMP